MNSVISPAKLKNLADLAAGALGLPPVSRHEIDELYRAEIPLPLLREGETARLWVDRTYIAFSERGGAVRYLYLSVLHIAEELSQERRVRALRKSAYRLPEDIRSAFDWAVKAGVRKRGYVTDSRILARFCGISPVVRSKTSPRGVEMRKNSCIIA